MERKDRERKVDRRLGKMDEIKLEDFDRFVNIVRFEAIRELGGKVVKRWSKTDLYVYASYTYPDTLFVDA